MIIIIQKCCQTSSARLILLIEIFSAQTHFPNSNDARRVGLEYHSFSSVNDTKTMEPQLAESTKGTKEPLKDL